eukprot:scaffold37357_cov24-Tisochrysis_lutea.AAC.1
MRSTTAERAAPASPSTTICLRFPLPLPGALLAPLCGLGLSAGGSVTVISASGEAGGDGISPGAWMTNASRGDGAVVAGSLAQWSMRPAGGEPVPEAADRDEGESSPSERAEPPSSSRWSTESSNVMGGGFSIGLMGGGGSLSRGTSLSLSASPTVSSSGT